MPEVTVGRVPFKEAIASFRNKLNIPSKAWDDMRGSVHAKAFTVAGATKAALLKDLRSAVDDAIANGTTITEFRKQFDKAVSKHGWSFKGKRGWRTRTIYNTNLRTARAAGRWEQIQRTKKTRPYLMYLTVGDQRVRPEHDQWNNKVLLADDAWWGTHYPPNDWGCRCTVRTLSQRQLEREDLTTSKAPPLNLTERINTRTGEIYGNVPQGIGVGWDYNVGKAWLGPDIAFGEQIMAMPSSMRNAALREAQSLAPKLQAVFAPWVTKLLKRKKLLGEIKTVGYIKPRIIDELAKRQQQPTTAVLTVVDRDITHMLREAKDGKHLPVDMIRALPTEINNAKAVLWDKRNPALLYIFDAADDRTAKIVIRVNYKTKARAADGERHSVQTNSVRTGSLVPLINLRDRAIYDVIDGAL